VKALVTGGGGFLGSAIARALAARGDEVTSLARGTYPELEDLGVRCVRADLADPAQGEALARAVRGADVVFHAAARAGIWGPRAAYWQVNVEGTRRVLAACLEAGVARLVFTSSPSVCFDGRDHVRASNDLPYAERFLAPYPASKAAAEREVLAADGLGGLSTCALRPHLIFGPGDPHLLPRLVERARAGKLAIVGDGRNEVTLCYVDDAARAHLQAAERLAPGAAHAGRAYFIGQAEPVNLWGWVNELLARLGLPPVERRVPAGVARAAGGALELVWRALRLRSEPRMTRFLAAQLSTSHSYDMEPARRDFGYEPSVSMPEALDRTVQWLRALAR